jgi:hypothetical protein
LIGNNNCVKIENNNFNKLYTSEYVYFFDKKLVIQGNYEHERTASTPSTRIFKNRVLSVSLQLWASKKI